MPDELPLLPKRPGMNNPPSPSSSSLPNTNAASAPDPAPAATSEAASTSTKPPTASGKPTSTAHPSASPLLPSTTRDDRSSISNQSSKSNRRTSASGSSLRSSFLSRLSLPLPNRARNRNIFDFHISPHEPHKRYSPGDHVRGSVQVVLVKPLRITHLTVSLTGYVRVFKDPTTRAQNGAGQDVTALLPQGGSERPQYHGHGFASLFQDEQILSGDGRLDAGKYEFGFDLVFPSKGLPSSIDFERGTISYIITATLTRPTSIAPTTTTDRRVTLTNPVDIALVKHPSPKTVFLEPISKKNRRKKSFGFDKATQPVPDLNDLASEAGSADPSVITDDSGGRTVEQRIVDHSDIQSEISGESTRSVSTGGLSRAQLSQMASARQQVVDDKTITATVSLTRGGCLPGDMVSVRVNVQHIKHLKSMNGVIVTLYRQGKIESQPDPSLFTSMMTKEERRKREREEVYPRSRTGLAGLSLSSSTSLSLFRKDLDQNTAPLIVDPVTLQASVTVHVRMPGDSFPTIRRVPGDMIRFVYQVEVVMDLGGNLSNQFKGGRESRTSQSMGGPSESGNHHYSPRSGQNITDTEPLRREKGVIALSMETIVGTVDSSRGRTRQRVSPSSRTIRTTFSDDDNGFTDYGPEEMHYGTPYVNGNPSNGYFSPSHPYDRPPSLPHPLTPGGPVQPYPYATANGESSEAPAYIPPPQLPEQHQMSEKERIRQAETRLLPSQPPAGPSAPEEENIYDAEDTPRLPHANPSSPQTIHENGPSAPTHDDLSRPDDPHANQDKQEVERQRLMGEASAPPEFPDDMDRRQAGPSAPDMAPEAEPSAPTLNEEDEFGYGGGGPSSASGRGHNEQLPAYER